MQFHRFALVSSVIALAACGGGDKQANVDTTKQMAPAAPAAAPTTAAANAVVPMAPITGKTIDVKMVQTASGAYEFQPKDITVKEGDGIKFIIVSGIPHNVSFADADVPDPAVRSQLAANMGSTDGTMATPFLTDAGTFSIISFAKIPPGKYNFICQPHANMNMTGSVTVTP